MTNSPEAILGILLRRICFVKECRVYSRYHRRSATAIVAGIWSAKSVGSAALIVQAVTFCFGAGCGPWMCMVCRARRRKEGRQVMSD